MVWVACYFGTDSAFNKAYCLGVIHVLIVWVEKDNFNTMGDDSVSIRVRRGQPAVKRVTVEVGAVLKVTTTCPGQTQQVELFSVTAVKRGRIRMETLDGKVLEIKVIY